MSTNGEMKKNGANYVIQWKTSASQPEAMQRGAQSAGQQETHRYSRAYRDPTADAAIGNIMREERMKKKQKDMNCQMDKKCRRNSNCQRNSTYQKERNRRRAEAWRAAKAQETKAHEAKARGSQVHEAQTNPAIQGGDCHVEK